MTQLAGALGQTQIQVVQEVRPGFLIELLVNPDANRWLSILALV